MSRHLPPLRALAAFEAVARHHSVARAAEELSITPSAVSHRLKNLETHLGVRLFHRTTRAIALSDAGRDYLQSIASAFDRIQRSSDRLAGGMASDVLTIHCPPSFAPAWLVPRIGKFMAEHPDIDLRIHASPEPVDFFRSDTDAEIRYGNSDWTGLVVRPLMQDVLAPLCAPSLIARIRDRPVESRLDDVPLIVSERAPVNWPGWFKTKGLPATESRGPIFDRGYLALQAAAEGLGVALESVVFAADYIAAGRLARVFDEQLGDLISGAHTLVYPPVYAEVRKIRLFERWALKECGERADASQ